MEKVCGEFQLKKTHNCFFQVQQQLFTLPERNYNDFEVCAFDSNHCTKIVKEGIYRDPCHWQDVLPELTTFWRVCILPEILDRWYMRKCVWFSIGSFQRLKKEQVNAELDKTLEADAQIVELKRQLAAKKVEIDALGKQLHKKEEIVRRRKRKVCSDHHCVFWYMLWFLEDLLVHVQQLLF